MSDTLTWDLIARDKSAGAMFEKLSRSVDGLADHMDKFGQKTSASFKQAERDAKKSAEGMADGVGDAFSDLAGRVGGPIGDMLGSLQDGFTSFKGGALAAGALIGGAFLQGVTDLIEQNRVGGTIAAAIGGGTADVGRLGGIAGDIYADNFGESVAEVGDAITAVFQNKLIDTDATDAAIQEMTSAAITASQVVGEEVNNIGRAARQLFVNHLAGNATEAMDLIVHASQEGLNVNGDLLDTIIEYAGQFDRLGITGPQSLGLISQAMTGGARDTDYAADALKEFVLKAQDGSLTTARGFRTIGLNAESMGQAIASGGSSAATALDATLDGLNAIHDPVLRNQAAVDLFGTKAEDLGQALFDMNLDTAADDFGRFAGATDDASKRLAEAAPIWETFGRNLGGALTGAVEWAAGNQGMLDSLTEQLPEVTKAAIAANQAFTESDFTDTSKLEALKEEYPELADKIDAYIETKQKEKGATEDTDGSVQQYIQTLDELIKKNNELAGGALSLFDAHTSLAKSWDDLTAGLKENGLTLDENTAKGQANRENLSGWVGDILNTVEAMETQGAGTAEVTGFLEAQREAYLDHVDAMGGDRVAAGKLLDQLKLIPGNYIATTVVDSTGAVRKLTDLEGYINFVTRERFLNIRYNINGNAMAKAGLPTGGHHIPGLAEGGPAKAGEPYVVGEEGMELFVPDQNGRIIPNDEFMASANSIRPPAMAGAGARGSGGSAPVTVVFQSGGGRLEDMFAEIVNRMMRNGAITGKAL